MLKFSCFASPVVTAGSESKSIQSQVNPLLRHWSVEEIYPLNDFPSIPVVGTAQNLGFYLTFGHSGGSQQ